MATHIDSWEVGSQNWTSKLREDFQKRRGYDPLPWLPCLTDSSREKVNGKTSTRYARNLDGAEMANRFRWDFAQTISELLAENYSGRLAKLAHEQGLRFTLEGYEFTYTARADEPMTEFWTMGWFGKFTKSKAVGMASVAHVYGRAIVGAEAFTSGDHEMWKLTPADIKTLGDYEFSQGVNRFVIHRYAHQPYLDRVPGATMGPWAYTMNEHRRGGSCPARGTNTWRAASICCGKVCSSLTCSTCVLNRQTRLSSCRTRCRPPVIATTKSAPKR